MLALCSSLQAADDPSAALPEPAPAGATSERPGILWGTVITRDQFAPLTNRQRWDLYWRQAFWSPSIYVASLGIAAYGQRNNDPYQWGQGFDAYVKRAANEYGRLAIQDTIEAAGAAALKQDVRYVKCQCRGTLRRVAYAIGMNFVTLNEQGKYRPAYAHYAGAIGAQYIGNTWMPNGYRNWDTNLRDGGLQLAFNAGFNIVREFFPSKRN